MFRFIKTAFYSRQTKRYLKKNQPLKAFTFFIRGWQLKNNR